MTTRIDWGLDAIAWRDLAARCPGATFYHTPGWYLTQATRHGYGLDAARLTFADGTEALLPVATRRAFRGVLREALSGIEGAYGGLTATAALTPLQVASAYKLAIARYPDLAVTGSPHEAFCNTPSWPGGGEDHSHVVPLLERDPQLAMMGRERARQTRRAREAGFRLEVVERPDDREVARFFPVYAAHARNWAMDRWVRDEAYFQALLHHAGAQLVLFYVYCGDELAGFRLVARHGPVVLCVHLARAAGHEKTGASVFLLAESMAWCHERGHTAIDLLPSGPLAGVGDYKASFGARTASFGVAQRRSWLGAPLEAAWRLAKGRPSGATA